MCLLRVTGEIDPNAPPSGEPFTRMRASGMPKIFESCLRE